MSQSLAGKNAISVRLLTPWQGVWVADVDYDLDDASVPVTGRVALVVGGQTLTGTVDPRGSGRFGAAARARVVGGGGGWDKIIPAKDFASDALVTSTIVFTSTASEVGETVSDLVPARLGAHFVRTAGPASRVLANAAWFVDYGGITVVGARAPVAPSSDVEILSWDPATKTAEFASDTLLVPGSVLIDPRFERQTVRDVEQTFQGGRARGIAWCGDKPVSRLAAALQRLVEEKAGLALLRKYRYRVVSQAADARLTLQAVSKASGVPDVLPVPAFFGVPGCAARLTPGAIVIVEFVEGDPTMPLVVGYDATTPLEVDIYAATVKLGGTTLCLPLAKADPVNTVFTALSTLAAALAPVVLIGAPAQGAATALAAAIANTGAILATTRTRAA